MCMCPCCMHAFTQMYAWVHVDVPERVQVPRDWNVQVCVCAATAPKRRTLNPKYQICSNCTSKSNLLAKRDVRIILNEEKYLGTNRPPPPQPKKKTQQTTKRETPEVRNARRTTSRQPRPTSSPSRPTSRQSRPQNKEQCDLKKWNFERGHHVTPNIQRK
jgi:hypothetical protein